MNIYKTIKIGKMDVVISKYKNDMSWVTHFKSCQLFIYDKSNEINEFIQLPNIGRESHTYLYHIIENYENLNDYTCFLQGYPFDHTIIKNIFQFVNFIETFNKPVDFLPLGTKITENHGDRGWNVQEFIFNKFFIDNSNTVTFTPGACFIVSKSAILNRKKEFYELIMDDFFRIDDNYWYSHLNSNKMPWLIERSWEYIFNKNFRSKYDREN